MSKGWFVALEGGEGAGKSTQSRLIAERFSAGDITVVTTFEPGESPVGRALRAVLLDRSTGALDPRTEALLYAADRAEHVARVIRPALDQGALVVCDRYLDSSLAYQGAGRGLDLDEVEGVSMWATGGLLPDLTVVLDVDPSIGLTRTTGSADRLEAEPLAFHQRVRQAFLDLAARDPQRYVVVDASAATSAVHEQIIERVDALRAVSAT